MRAPVLTAKALHLAWGRFWLGLWGMTALGAFSLWRVDATVWRPAAERVYLFEGGSWLGYVERCWFNDLLYALGMAGILYVLYTLKEALAARAAVAAELTIDRWCEHQERSRLMIGVGLVIVLLWAWLEEVADLVPGYIFDKWDLAAIFYGFVAGWSLVRWLPYPVFGARPALREDACRRLGIEELNRAVCCGFVWWYTAVTDPVTTGDRWSHLGELSVLILGSACLLAASRKVEEAPWRQTSSLELACRHEERFGYGT